MNETKDEISLGEYKIIDAIGSGGFGTVYKVKHPNGEIFAAKVPHCRYGKFKEEVSALEGLIHKNIIGYRGAYKGNKPPFYLMPYIPNGSLAQAKKPIDTELALIIAHQILEGLKYAHEKGYIHGDLKPSNILLGKEAMIADFGLVSQADPSSFANTLNTVSTKITGTYDYMSPEQKEGFVDKRNDIYSTGVILYNMLTNRLVTNARKPSELNKNVPQSIDNLILKAMDNIDERYQTADEFCKAVSALLNKSPKTKIKDCLSARYVPANMLAKNPEVYLPEIETAIEKIREKLEQDLEKKIDAELEKDGSKILSKTVKVKIENYSIDETKLHYYPVELSEDKTEYKTFTGSTHSTKPNTRGALVKKAITVCQTNNEWDVAPDSEANLFSAEKGVELKKPTWHYPEKYISIDLDINISAEYETDKLEVFPSKELLMQGYAKTWKAHEKYSKKAHIRLSGFDKTWIEGNSIKIDDILLKEQKTTFYFEGKPETPLYLTLPIAGLALATGIFAINQPITSAAAGLAAGVSTFLAAHYGYKLWKPDKIKEKRKNRAETEKQYQEKINKDKLKKVSIETGHIGLMT